MHVRVVRRGGIAGVVRRGEVDSAEVPDSADAEQLLRALPFDRRPEPGTPDRFLYEITVTEGEQSRSAQLGEAELPDGLRPLVDAALARGSVD